MGAPQEPNLLKNWQIFIQEVSGGFFWGGGCKISYYPSSIVAVRFAPPHLFFTIQTGTHIRDTRSVHVECPGNWPPLIISALLMRGTFVQQVTRDWTCFNHTVRRWYPVANISLHRKVQLYETHARGGKECLCNTELSWIWMLWNKHISIFFQTGNL
jgi:hypothetical protein